jgi:hypothetical protein
MKRSAYSRILKDVKQICDDCARKNNLIMPHNHIASYWTGKCDVCNEEKMVTDIMDFERTEDAKKIKSTWNYRVVTRMYKDTRLFSITEVYYTNEIPDSYIEPKDMNLLSNVESVKDLKWIRKKTREAFKKPILDLDNFPNKYLK